MSETNIVTESGDSYWYKGSRIHRLDGPAYISRHGDEEWWQEGRLHRLDGPAIVMMNGAREWFRNNEHHRLDGPAIIDADGKRLWIVNDVAIPIVLARVRDQAYIFTNQSTIFQPYPSHRFIRVSEGEYIGGHYLDDTDLTLFMITHTVVEMPYE